jgi:hypothetical protein
MDLGEVYSSRVSGKFAASSLSFGGQIPNIERDPFFDKLENSVLSKFNEILDINEDKNEIVPVISNTITTFGFEDALKELISLKNKGVTSS